MFTILFEIESKKQIEHEYVQSAAWTYISRSNRAHEKILTNPWAQFGLKPTFRALF